MRPEEQREAGERYTVVARTLVFLTRNGPTGGNGEQVLLLKGAPTKRLWAGKYNGVGGHLEPGESLYASALRELHEETGLTTVEELTLRGIVHITMPQPPGIVLFVFVGEAQDNGPGESTMASDEGSAEWVDLDEIAALPLVDDLPELLPRILSEGPMTFAHYEFDADGLHIRFD